MNNQQSAAQVVANNFAARAALLSTGIRFRSRGSFAGSAGLGGKLSAVLSNQGLITGILLILNIPIVAASAAGVVQAEDGAYELIPNVSLVDYAQRSRCNWPASVLARRNAIINGRPVFTDSSPDTARPTAPGWFDGVFASLTGSPTNGTYTLKVPVYIPVCVDHFSDLRGALLAQTDAGQIVLSASVCPALVAATGAPFTAGTGLSLGAAGVTAEYYIDYIMPQGGFGSAALPLIDLATIYELASQGTDASNILAGNSKFINWPNNRSVLAMYHKLQPGIVYDRLKLLANGSTILRDDGVVSAQCNYVALTGDVLPPDYLYIGARRQPISTLLIGNVQTVLDVTAVTGTPSIASYYEATYLAGSSMSGVAQG